MSYGIFRQEKVKTASDVAGLEGHDLRLRESWTNPHINKDLSVHNYSLIEWNNNDLPFEEKDSWNTRLDKRIKVGYNSKGVIKTGSKKGQEVSDVPIRKDAVRAIQLLFTSNKEFFDILTEDEINKFFQDCFEWACKLYGKDNIIAATVHFKDERVPHLSVITCPLTSDGRYSANECMGVVKDSKAMSTI